MIIKFQDVEDETQIEVTSVDNAKDCLQISIDDKIIWLDIDTSIRFAKELRRQIAIIKDNLLTEK